MLPEINLDQNIIFDEFGYIEELSITHHILLQYLVDTNMSDNGDIIFKEGDKYCSIPYEKMKSSLPLLFNASISNRTISRYIKTLCDYDMIYVFHDVYNKNKPYYAFPSDVVSAYCSIKHPDEHK